MPLTPTKSKNTNSIEMRAFLNAAKNGDNDTLKALLDAGADVNAADNNGNTALIWAAREGHTEAVQALLTAGADTNATGDYQRTALVFAIVYGHTEIAQALLASGADVNAADEDAETALTLAAQKGYTKIALALLAAGADVNPVDKYGNTALIRAARLGHTEIVRALLAAGADVNAANEDAQTALTWASVFKYTEIEQVLLTAGATVIPANKVNEAKLIKFVNRKDTTSVNALLNSGVNVNSKNQFGETALIIAVKNNDAATIQALLNAGADVNATDRIDNTALSWAALRGHTETVQALLAAGADVNTAGKDGDTALLLAAKNGHLKIAKTLLAAGATINPANKVNEDMLIQFAGNKDTTSVNALLNSGVNVNSKNLFGETALIIAVLNNDAATIQALLNAGADVNATDRNDNTTLSWAALRGHTETVQALLAAGADVNAADKYGYTALIIAAQHGYTETVQALLTASADVNTTDRNDNTALSWAALNGRLKIAKALLAAGADVKAAGKDGDTALIFAAQRGHTETVHTLLAAGADVNAANKYGRTALLLAARDGYTETVQALLTASADVNTADKYGHTALISAAQHGRTETVQALLAARADVNAANQDGDTALLLAAKNGYLDIAKTLLTAGATINPANKVNEDMLIHFTGNKDTTSVNALLNSGVNVNSKNLFGDTALIIAVKNNDTATIQALLNAGADVNAADKNGNTALSLAALKGHLEITKLLRDASINRSYAKPFDCVGTPVCAHLDGQDRDKKSASTIQTRWRQYYRATYLHRTPTLFGEHSKNSLKKNPVYLPNKLHHLHNIEMPPLFTSTTHHSDRMDSILHDGIIYPSKISNIHGSCSDSDTQRHDRRLAFTAPFTNTVGRKIITFNIEALLETNNPNTVYFKLIDYPLSSPTKSPIMICDEIHLHMTVSFPKHYFSFTDNNGTLLARVELNPEECVYHGMDGLHRYLTLFIFKIIHALPSKHNNLKQKIYDHFTLLYSENQLIPHLQGIMKRLLNYSEFDFVNPIKLTFTSIDHININNNKFNLAEFRNHIKNSDDVGMMPLIDSMDFLALFKDSYMLSHGLLKFLEHHASKEIYQLIQSKGYLKLAETEYAHAMSQSLKHKPIPFHQFKKATSQPKKGSTIDSGAYYHNPTNQDYFVKSYSNPEQCRAELLAAKLYQAAGLLVPETCLVDNNGKLGVASKIYPSITSVAAPDSKPFPNQFGCHEGFIVDAWLANWDVIGLELDNMYTTQEGFTLRLDFGGALHFHATGGEKQEFFNHSETISELDTMRNTGINRNAASVFANISIDDLKLGAARIQRISPTQIRELVRHCFADTSQPNLIEQLSARLCQRREKLITQYKISFDDPIDLIARDILAAHYQKPPIKFKHGAMHVSRVALYIPLIANLYNQTGVTISDEDIKLMQIAALFHDSGRQNDTGDDQVAWERTGSKHCYDYLITLGISHTKASRIADSITNKDSDITKKKGIYRKLLQNADCLDVLRSHSWVFDYTYMDFYKEFGSVFHTNTALQHAFHQLIEVGTQLVSDTCDLKQAYTPKHKPTYLATWDETQKIRFETSKTCFKQINDIVDRMTASLPLKNQDNQTAPMVTDMSIPEQPNDTPMIDEPDDVNMEPAPAPHSSKP